MNGYPFRAPVKAQEKTFDLTRLGATTRSTAQFRTSKDDWELDVADTLVHDLVAYALTDHLASKTKEVAFTKTVVFRLPETWWDQFKADQVEATSPLWRWVAARWPARYREEKVEVAETRLVTFHRDAIYPQANVMVPGLDLGHPVTIEYYTEEKVR